MDNWDPMKHDFEDEKFNSYSEGVGRDLLDSTGSATGVQLFVGNLPKSLGNEGLYNLFAEYGGVVNARLKETEGDTNFGFVNMRSAVDGEKAISKLHKKRLGNSILKVSVKLTREEKERRQNLRERESEFMSSLRKDFNWDETGSVKSSFSDTQREGSDRSEHLAARGRSRGLGREAQAFSNHPMNFGSGFGRHVTPPVYGPMPLFPGRGQPDPRFGGQGLLPAPGCYPGPDMFAMRQQMQRNKEMMNQGPSRYIDIQVPENPRLKEMKCCTFCRKDGCENFCSRCRLYYCSVECQRKDWPNHKDICVAFGEYYKSKGEHVPEQRKENGGKLSNGDASTEFKKSPKKPKGSGRYDSDNSNSQEDADLRKSSACLPQKGNSRAQKSNNQGRGDFKAKKTSESVKNFQGSGNRLSGSDQEKGKGAQVKEKQGAGDGYGQKDHVQTEDVEPIKGGAGDAADGLIQMTIPVGSSGAAYLTHYENPHKFWISLVEQLEEFTETTILMSQQASANPPSNPKPRDTFGAMWEGEWARVVVTEVSGDEVGVFFMDYGNTGVVKIKDLRPLTVDIIKLPAQALCCSVSKIKPKGGAWSKAAVSKVQEWFGPPMTKNFSFEIVAKRGTKNAVKISIENEGLSEFLLSDNYGERDTGEPGLPSITAGPKQPKVSRFTVKDLKSECDSVNVGDQLTTAMLSFQYIRKFFAVKQSAADILPELEALMATEHFSEQPCFRPTAGDIVAAVYSEDKKWYRSQVLKVEGDTCSLFFVDYGNEEDQTVQNVKEIRNQKIKDIPAQTLACCLHGLDTFPPAVTQDDLAAEFAQILPTFQVDETWTLLSVKAKEENHLVVDIVSSRGRSLVDALRNKFPGPKNKSEAYKPPEPEKSNLEVNKFPEPGKSKAGDSASSYNQGKNVDGGRTESSPNTSAAAKKPMEVRGEQLPINPAKTVTVEIPHVHDCGQFYVRPASNAQKFQAMMTELNKTAQKRPKFQDPPAVGTVAMVQFSVDRLWYRGCVQSVESFGRRGHCKVIFMDYGNSEMVPWVELRELDPTMCKLPAQAVRCRLAGEVEQLPADSHLEFKQYLENETVDIKVVGGDVDGIEVQMIANGIDINALFFGDNMPQESAVSRKISNLVLDPACPVKIECVNMASPASFYVQVASHVSAAMQATLDLKMRLEINPQPVRCVCVGDFVASKFSEDCDELWYRARVDKIKGDKALVYFVDFGNFEETAKAGLMCLTEEDYSVPAGTLKCCLRGCEKSTPEMDAKFAREGQIKIDSIRIISQSDQACVVDVLDGDGRCITDVFIPAQKSSPVKPKVNKSSPVSPKPKASVAPQSVPLPATSDLLPTESLGELNSSTDASVTHIDSFSSIYVTSTDSNLQSKLLQLMVALNQSAESLPPLGQPRQGSLCAACFSQDGSWYRARILSVVSSTICEVQFVDYGNSEQTLTSQLRELTGYAIFTELPAQAVKCCLVGFESGINGGADVSAEPEADLVRLKEELVEKAVRFKMLKKVGETLVVDFENEQHSSIGEMFKRSLKTSEDITSSVSPKPKASVAPQSVPLPATSDLLPTESSGELNSSTDASVTHIDSFSSIYVTSTDSNLQSKLLQLMVALNQSAESLPPLGQPRQGSLCAACFSQDGNWYRARILSVVSSTICEVQFVDYGNSEQTLTSQLRELTGYAIFTELPAQAVKCCLVGFESGINGGADVSAEPEADLVRLKEELVEKAVRFKMLKKVGETLVVDFENEQHSSIGEMFKRSLKTSEDITSSVSPKPKASVAPQSVPLPATSDLLPTESLGELNSSTDASVTHIDSFSSIYVTSTDSNLQSKLLQLMVALNQSAESLPPLGQPRQGSLCAACFSQDGSWYRARILSVVSSTICEVQFVDYGNSEQTLTSQLRELTGDASFTELPAQAVKCCLVGFESRINGSADVSAEPVADLVRLKEELVEKAVRVKLLKKVGEAMVVDFENEHQLSIGEMFEKQSMSAEKVAMLSDLVHEKTSETEFDAFLLQLTKLDEFYCHRCNEEEMTELMMMGELLQADVSHLPPGTTCTPVVGGLYASEFQGVWYRCVVEKVDGSQVLIKYVDFGNCEVKSAADLRPLNKKRLSMPVRILKCKLYGVTPVYPNWEHPDMPAYLQLLSMKQPRLRVHGENDQGFVLVSMLVDDGQGMMDVGEDLVRIGMATELAGKSASTPQSSANAAAQVQETSGLDVQQTVEDEEEDELELAKQIEFLQKQLQLTKLKKAKGAKK